MPLGMNLFNHPRDLHCGVDGVSTAVWTFKAFLFCILPSTKKKKKMERIGRARVCIFFLKGVFSKDIDKGGDCWG